MGSIPLLSTVAELAGYLPLLMEWCGFESRSPDYPAIAQSAERLTVRCAPPHSPAFLSSPAAVTALAVRARVGRPPGPPPSNPDHIRPDGRAEPE